MPTVAIVTNIPGICVGSKNRQSATERQREEAVEGYATLGKEVSCVGGGEEQSREQTNDRADTGNHGNCSHGNSNSSLATPVTSHTLYSETSYPSLLYFRRGK